MSGRETVPAPGPVADFAPDARGGRLPFMAETEDDEQHSSSDDRCQFIKEELIIDSDEKSGEEDRPELDGAAAGAAGNTAHAIKIRDPTPPIQVVENLSTNEQSPPDVSFTSGQIVRKRRPYTKRKPKYSESSEGNQSTTNETERSSDGESSSAARQVKKLNETREEREKRLQVARDRRSLETDEQRRKRLECLKKYQSKRIANETEEQRRMRLYKLRIYHSNRIANETKEQRERRLLKTRLYQKERIAKLKLEKAMMNASTEENQNDESSNADSN